MYQGFLVCKGYIDSGNSATGPTGPVGKEGWFVIDISSNQIPFPNVTKVAATYTSEMRYGNYIFNYTHSSQTFDSEMTYIKYSDFINGEYIQTPVVFNMKLDYHKGIDVFKGYIAGCGMKSGMFSCYLTYVCTNLVHFKWSKDLPQGFGVTNFRIEVSIRLGVVLLYTNDASMLFKLWSIHDGSEIPVDAELLVLNRVNIASAHIQADQKKLIICDSSRFIWVMDIFLSESDWRTRLFQYNPPNLVTNFNFQNINYSFNLGGYGNFTFFGPEFKVPGCKSGILGLCFECDPSLHLEDGQCKSQLTKNVTCSLFPDLDVVVEKDFIVPDDNNTTDPVLDNPSSSIETNDP